MPFEPGQSGNPEGTQKYRRFIGALDRAIAQDDGKRLRAAAEKLLDLAADGELQAINALADRLDGKVAQSVSISADLTVTTKKAADLSDDQLATIATASASSNRDPA